jgi:hypothetical protein
MKGTVYIVLSLTMVSWTTFAQPTDLASVGIQTSLYPANNDFTAFTDSLRNDDIPVHGGAFSKSKNATFLWSSNRIEIGCWVDASRWGFHPAYRGELVEYEFNHENGMLCAMIITDDVVVPVVPLVNSVFRRVRGVISNIRIIGKEYRRVNGLNVLAVYMTGTIQNIPISYYGYYYSSAVGTTLFVAYSPESFMKENQPAIEELLNGLVPLID